MWNLLFLELIWKKITIRKEEEFRAPYGQWQVYQRYLGDETHKAKENRFREQLLRPWPPIWALVVFSGHIVPSSKEKAQRGSSLKFWLSQADSSRHDNEIIDNRENFPWTFWPVTLHYLKFEFTAIKTVSGTFYSLCLKTWLSIQVQQFCRRMWVFSLEAFLLSWKVFYTSTSPCPELLADCSSFLSCSHLTELVYVATIL